MKRDVLSRLIRRERLPVGVVGELPVLSGERVTLRPLLEADLDPLIEKIASDSVRRWWGPGDDPQRERDDLRSDGKAFVIEVDGTLAGWLGVCEEPGPDYRHAALDIMLDDTHQDRGLGPEALRLCIEWLVSERGHHRVTIDPDVDNERAIRAYRAVGFRDVGVMRRYGRGADGDFHDGLLMDLLADELRPAGAGGQ